MLLYEWQSFSILGKNQTLQKQTLQLENSNDANHDETDVHLAVTQHAVLHWNKPGTLFDDPGLWFYASSRLEN